MAIINPSKNKIQGVFTKDDYQKFQEYNRQYILDNNLTADQIEKAYLNNTFTALFGDNENFDDMYTKFKKLDLGTRRMFLRKQTGSFKNYNDMSINQEEKPKQENTEVRPPFIGAQTQPLHEEYNSYLISPEKQITYSPEAPITNAVSETSNLLNSRLFTLNYEEDKYGTDIEDLKTLENLRNAFDQMRVEADKIKPSFWERLASGFDESGQTAINIRDKEWHYDDIQKALRGDGISDWVKQRYKLSDLDVEVYNKNRNKVKNSTVEIEAKDIPEFAAKAKTLARANSPVYRSKFGTKWLKEGEDYDDATLAEQYRQYLINKDMFGETAANHMLDNYFRDIVSDNETFLENAWGSIARLGGNFVGGTIEGAGFIYGLASAPFRPEDNVKGLNGWQNYWQKVFINDVSEYGNKVAKYGTLSPEKQEWAKEHGDMNILPGMTRPSNEVDGGLANQLWSLYTIGEVIGNAGYTASAIMEGGIAASAVKGGAKITKKAVTRNIKKKVLDNQLAAREGYALLRDNIKNINKVSGYVEAAIIPQVVSASEATANALETYDGVIEGLKTTVEESINDYYNEEIQKLQQESEAKVQSILSDPKLRKQYEEGLINAYNEQADKQFAESQRRNPEVKLVRMYPDYRQFDDWQQNLEDYIRVSVHNNEFLNAANELKSSLEDIREDAYARLEGEARLAATNSAAYTQLTNVVLDGMFRKALYPLSTQRHMKNIEQKIAEKRDKILKRDPKAAEFRKRFEIDPNTKEIKAKKPTIAKKAWAVGKEGASEFVAENQQTAADKASQGVARYDMAQYIDARLNGVADEDWSRDYSENYSQFFKGMVDAELGTNLSGFGGSAEDVKEVWFSSFMGLMGALTGTPIYNRNFNVSQRIQPNESVIDYIGRVLPISYRTPFVDGIRAVNNTYEANQKQAEQLNEFLANGGASLLEKGNGAKTWAAMAEIYADENNEFGMRTANFKSLCESMVMLSELQGTEMGQALLNELQQIAKGDEHSKALLNELVNEYKVNQRETIKEGTQVEDKDVELLQADATGEMTDEEIAEHIQANVAMALEVFEDMQTSIKEVREATQGGATEDVIQSLAATQLLERNLSKRQEVIEKNLGGTVETTPANSEIDYLIDYGTQEKAKEAYEKAKKEVKAIEEDLKKHRKEGYTKDWFIAQMKRADAKRRMVEAKKAFNEEWDSSRVYSAAEIMAMNPQDRERMLKNKNKLSTEQRAIIEQLVVDRTINNPKFMSEIEEAANLDSYLNKLRREFTDVISNPRDMNIYASRARQDRYDRNLRTKYEHLGNIQDYALFTKVFEENLKKDMQDSPRARKIAEEALKNNENYKKYKKLHVNSGKLKAALFRAPSKDSSGEYILFQGLSERQRRLTVAVIDWLTRNNIPINLDSRGQLAEDALTNDTILGYLSDNLAKLNEDISAGLEAPLDSNSTEALDAFRTMLGIKDEIDAQAEEAKMRAEIIKEGSKGVEQTETPEKTVEKREAVEAAPEEVEETQPAEPEEIKTTNDLQKLKEEGILNDDLLADLEEIAKIDEDLVFPISELIKVSMVTKENSQLPESWHELLKELIKESPASYIEALELLEELAVQYELTKIATNLHFQQYLDLIKDILESSDEKDVKKQINYQIVYQANTTSNNLAMAETANHLDGVLGQLYQQWGIDDFFYPKNPIKGQNRRAKIKKATVYYVALSNRVANDMFGNNTLKRRTGYPVAAVIEDANGPLTITIDGKETKVQPIGFIIDNTRVNRPGGDIATALRKAAYNMMPAEGLSGHTLIVDENNKPITTQGVIMKQFNSKALYNQTPKSIKDLLKSAMKKKPDFKGNLFNRVYVGPTKDKNGKPTGGTSIYYAMDNGQVESGRGNSVTEVLLLKKPFSAVTKEVSGNRYTLEEIIIWDDPTAINAFARFNSRIENYILTLEEAIEDGNTYAVDENAPEDAKNNVKKNLEELQEKLNRYIYLSGKKYELTSKLENGDQNIYIEYSPDGIETVSVKLFTIKSSNPNTEVDNTSLITQFKEALKDSNLREIFHFQVDHAYFAQEKNDGTLTEVPKGFNNYFEKCIEEDLLEARVTSLLPAALPTTNVVSGSTLDKMINQGKSSGKLISERLREMQRERNQQQAEDKEDSQTSSTNNAAQVENPSSDEANDDAGKPEIPETKAPETQGNVEDLDFSDLVDPSLRVVTSEETDLFDKNKELAWLQRVLPQMSRDELIKFKEGLIRLAGKPEAWGAVSNALAVLSDKAAKGTIYHEAFHVVFQNILDKDRQEKVLKEARQLYPDIKSDEALEEKLADDFMNFVENSTTATTFRGKIREFFEELLTKIIYWVSGKNAITQLYKDINNGKFAYSDIHTKRVETLVDVRESDINDFMTAIKNTDANSLGTLWENIFGVSITEEQIKSLRAATFDTAIFDALIQTQIRRAEGKMAEKLNDVLYNVQSYDNTQLQKEIDTIMKYKNGEKLNRAETKIVKDYIKKEGRNLYWTNKVINRLSNTIKENNKKREELLKDLKSLAIRQQVLKQVDTRAAIRNVLINQRENLRNNNINGKVIAEQIFSPKSKVSLREATTSDLSIERYSPEAIKTLDRMGITAEEFNNYPDELKDRIRHCCKL